MNKTLKYVGLLAILPLFTVVLTTGFVDDAFAKTSKWYKAPKICGDKLCSATSGSSQDAEREKARMALAKGTTPVEEKEEPKMEETMMEETSRRDRQASETPWQCLGDHARFRR